MAMPNAVVDGSNVAHEHRTAEGKPRVSNLTAVCDALEAEGFDVTVIVDAALFHQVDDPAALDKLIERGLIHQAPAGTDADYFILEHAEKTRAVVVSNDRFRDRQGEYPWLEERRVPLMIIDGHVELHEAELAEARQKAGDLVDKMSEDSFPASDPPSY